jgi:hypothetical protein
MLISQVPLINMRRFASYSNTCKGIQAILIIINHDYNIVIDSYSYHHIIIKLIILHLNTMNKPSPMSEGVAETRISNQPCKDINPDNTTHVGLEGTMSGNNSRHDQKSEPGLTLP